MARTRVIGATNRDSNYEVTARKPLDARSLVKTYDDLTNIDNWVNTSGNSIVYNGMLVAVWLNNDDTSKNGIYLLHDPNVTSTKGDKSIPNVENEANWHKLVDANGLAATLTEIDERLTALEEQESDVLTFGYRSGFPAIGEVNKLYVAADEGKSYVWFNDAYLPVSGGGDYEEPEVIYGGDSGIK